MIIAQFVLAASNPNNEGLEFDKPLNHNLDFNLALTVQLIAYLDVDLDRTIISNKLHTFTEVPPLYTKLTAAVTPKKRPQERERNLIMSGIGTGIHVET